MYEFGEITNYSYKQVYIYIYIVKSFLKFAENVWNIIELAGIKQNSAATAVITTELALIQRISPIFS